VATGEVARPGQVGAEEVARRIARAIELERAELYLSSATKWLMRVYHLFPGLMRLR